MSSVDLSSNANFMRLQSLQLSQVSEMNEMWTMMNKNFLELNRQLSELGTTHKEKPPDLLHHTPTDPDCMKPQLKPPYLQSVVDLDMPVYASFVLKDSNYTPTKHLKVDMSWFDGTDAEHWLFAVRMYFIFHKIPEDRKLLIVSFHLDGIAHKWFAWLEASNMLSTWKNFAEAIMRKFTNLHYCLPGGKLSKFFKMVMFLSTKQNLSKCVSKYLTYKTVLSWRCISLA